MKKDLLVLGWRGCLVLALILALRAPAEDFVPDLGQALETIDGGVALDVAIPGSAPERTAYPLPPYYSRPLLTEVPGHPFKQVDPPPQWPGIWKYPFYGGVGLPRDLLDATVGFFSHVPLISNGLYIVYEKVPTQVFLRDHRDWHRWDGKQNRNEHGFYDGTNWGYFSNWQKWNFRYPSKWAAKRNAKKNEELQRELNQMNREIEAQNFRESAALRAAKQQALDAIGRGDGAEAVKRTLPAREAYPQDEGIFALYVAALATYADQEAPQWVKPVLWRELNTAQPRALGAAEELLAKTAQQRPAALTIGKSVVYARELQSDRSGSVKAAQALLKQNPNDPELQRLSLETAIGTGKSETALPLWNTMQSAQLQDRESLAGRMELLQGNEDAALAKLTPLAEAHPEQAYYNYYLGAAELIRAQKTNSRDDFNRSFQHVEKAALGAPNAALRLRAGRALGYLRGVTAKIAGNPTLFSEDHATTATTPTTPSE